MSTLQKIMFAIILCAAVFVTITFMGFESPEPENPAPAVQETPLPTPSITILSPLPGATLPVGSVTISVQVKDFSLADTYGEENVPGVGHLLYYKNVEVPTASGQPAVTADDNTSPDMITTDFTWTNLTPGDYTFSVQLVNNDDTPLDTPVWRTIGVHIAPMVSPTPTHAVTTPRPTIEKYVAPTGGDDESVDSGYSSGYYFPSGPSEPFVPPTPPDEEEICPPWTPEVC
jgi:hypothetical protein